MDTKFFKAALILLTIMALAACTLPGPLPQPDQTSPTPNLTMTALFSTPLPTQPGQATATFPAVITATPQATTSNPTQASTATSKPPVPSATNVPPTAVPPTKTSPPPTATLDVSHRSGTSVEAATMKTPPTLDGGWTDFPVHDYAIPFTVYGKGSWKDSNDLSASYRIGWDKNNLYVAVKVRDDIYAQAATGADIFKGDSLELLLDTNISGDFFVQQTNSDDYQLGVSFGKPDVNGTHEAWLWQPANVAGSRTQVKVDSTRNETEHLTRVEVIIPWSLFGVTPKTGMHFGFALSVSDNDDTTKNVQQTMISTAANRGLFNPTTWGDLVLK
jgi:predicted small lipoprotein YifL